MEVVNRSVCGLSIEKAGVMATIRKMSDDGSLFKETYHYSLIPEAVKGISKSLKMHKIDQIAVVSDGLSWRPIWDRLEKEYDLLLTNKDDLLKKLGTREPVNISDCLSEMHQYGQLKKRYVPDAFTRELRDLTRLRESICDLLAVQSNRLQTFLAECGVKPSAYSNIDQIWAEMTGNSFYTKRLLSNNLLGWSFSSHQRFILETILSEINESQKRMRHVIDQIEKNKNDNLNYYRETVFPVVRIPGLFRRSAENILAEIGFNLTRFTSIGMLAAWTGVWPFSVTDGEIDDGVIGKSGNRWLKRALSSAAMSVLHFENAELVQIFRKHRIRYGSRRAMWQVEYSILWLIYKIVISNAGYGEVSSNLVRTYQRKSNDNDYYFFIPEGKDNHISSGS